ncbi:uncharacterized protein LOC111084062, partial [Limulus polyphemus]|uniref:Uncharacterized protein LOC111084062 n=1 Tax=Limulus polyphemus TaxID=6850 RepID=A0ABM1RYV0_LIMPO
METDRVTLPARDSFSWFCDYRKSEAFRPQKLVISNDSDTGLSEETNLRSDGKKTSGNLRSDGKKTSGNLSPDGKKTSVNLRSDGKKTSGSLSPDGKKTSGNLSPDGKKTFVNLSPDGKKTSGNLSPDGKKTSGSYENNSLRPFSKCHPPIDAQATPLAQAAGVIASDNTRKAPDRASSHSDENDEVKDTGEPPKYMDREDKSVREDERCSIPQGCEESESSLNPMKSDLEIGSNLLTWRDHLIVQNDAGNFRKERHKDFKDDIVKNDAGNLRKERHKDFKDDIVKNDTGNFRKEKHKDFKDDIVKNDTGNFRKERHKDFKDDIVKNDTGNFRKEKHKDFKDDIVKNDAGNLRKERHKDFKDDIVKNDAGNLRKERHKDFKDDIVKNDAGNFRNERHKDFKRCSRQKLIPDRKIKRIDRGCDQQVFNLTETASTSSPESKIVGRTSRSRLRSPEDKTEGADQKKLVRTPRAISLERATLRRRSRIGDGYHTPPRNYLTLSEQILYWDAQDGRCRSNKMEEDEKPWVIGTRRSWVTGTRRS